MKVLFLKDVPRVARAGDIKEVKNGYGRNYLLPQGLAVVATKEAIARTQGLREAAEERRLREAADWQQVAEALAGRPVEVEARSGPTGRLYGSVTSIMVAQKLSEMAGRTVDRRNVRFREPVRQTGEFSVPVRLQENVEVEIKLVVRAAGAPAAPKAQEGPQAAPKTPDAGPETPTQAPDEAQGHGP